MTKKVLYTYLGTNGVLTTPIHIENVYSIKKFELRADEGKVLTKDGKEYFYTIRIPEADLDLWKEVVELSVK